MMLKGAQKKMYVVKLGEDSLFEEAYFVLRRESGTQQCGDMVSEANRIIRQSVEHGAVEQKKGRLRWQVVLGVGCGLLVGGGVATALCLLIC